MGSILEEIIIAGTGGQGVLSAGRLIAYAGMLEGKNVSWLPSYGPEMRGGTANCHVTVSEEDIGSPIINKATAAIIMNAPSLDKFEDMVLPNGRIVLNSSLMNRKAIREDVKIFELPATEIAIELGNAAYANIILLGKFIGETRIVSKESFENALKKILPEKKHYLIPKEMEAFNIGWEYNNTYNSTILL